MRIKLLGGLRLDLLHLSRGLVRAPGPPTAIVLMLSLALAINFVLFAVVNELLFRQLPVADPGRLVLVHGELPPSTSSVGTSIADFRDLRDQARLVALAGFNGRSLAVGTNGRPTVVPAHVVTANYFTVLGLAPAAGRFFSPSDDERGGPAVAVLSHRLWLERFAGSPDAVGRTIRVNGQPVTVIGIAPAGFAGPFIGFRFDLYVPLGTGAALDGHLDPTDRRAETLELFARLEPGATAAGASGELTRLAAPLNLLVPSHQNRVFTTAPMTGLDTDLASGVRALAALVLTLAGLGLLVASLNAGNLLLARAMTRQAEVALRQALGAGRGRLVRLQLLEAAILVGAAMAIGGLLAVVLRRGLLLLIPAFPLPLTFRLAFDVRVALVGVGLAIAAIATAGFGPALLTGTQDVADRLRSARGASRLDTRFRALFLSIQVGVAFTLLVGAGLVTRALLSSRRLDAATAARVATVPLDLTFSRSDETTGRRFLERLLARVRAMPGVESAALAAHLPFGFGAPEASVRVPGHEPPRGERGFRIEVNRVSAGWVETVGLPLVRGRAFTAADGPRGAPAVLINRAMAGRFWGEPEAVGRRVVVDDRPVDVVGVIDDRPFDTPGKANLPRIYLSADQIYSPRAILLARTTGPAGDGAAALFETVGSLDPDLPVAAIGTLGENLALAYLPQRMLAGATAAVAGLTLVLAAFGLYGLLSFWVATRERELGIRAALGAGADVMVRLALRQGLGPVTRGLGLGLVLAIGAGLLLRRFLLGVSPFDPVSYLVATGAFYLVAACACLLPARRAAATSPMATLRRG